MRQNRSLKTSYIRPSHTHERFEDPRKFYFLYTHVNGFLDPIKRHTFIWQFQLSYARLFP